MLEQAVCVFNQAERLSLAWRGVTWKCYADLMSSCSHPRSSHVLTSGPGKGTLRGGQFCKIMLYIRQDVTVNLYNN